MVLPLFPELLPLFQRITRSGRDLSDGGLNRENVSPGRYLLLSDPRIFTIFLTPGYRQEMDLLII